MTRQFLFSGALGGGGRWRPRAAAGVSHDPRGPDPAGDSVAGRVQTTECGRGTCGRPCVAAPTWPDIIVLFSSQGPDAGHSLLRP